MRPSQVWRPGECFAKSDVSQAAQDTGCAGWGFFYPAELGGMIWISDSHMAEIERSTV